VKAVPITCILLLISLLCCVAQPSSAQRPKVALVLSGGGAKGMAHVGVLKVLEEAGIKPDIITGTSMGSIIGGLYAIGYPADTLEHIIRSQNWSQVLSDQIPLKQVIYEEKPYFENQLVELPFEDGKIQAPRGLIYGQQIDLLLSRLALPAYPVSNFKNYPIPFRCVASDIVRGETVVMNNGYLPSAMRSSMSIPTAFTPITKDSMLLIDGGLIRNFPVTEAKEWGADIIIGVYTGWRQADFKDLSNFSDIMLQAGFLMSVKDAEAQMPYVDIYIAPDLKGYSAQDFTKSDSIIVRGERAARAKFAALKNLADSVNRLGPPPRRLPLPEIEWMYLSKIEVVGNNRFSEEEIIGRSGLSTGKTIQVENLEAAINRLVGTNYFEKVSYELRLEDGLTVLQLNCIEKSPNLIRAAIHYDKYTGAGILFNLSTKNLLLPSSRLMLESTIADNYRFRLEYLKYLDKEQRAALATTVGLTRDEIPIFQDGRQNESFRLIEYLIDLRLQRRVRMSHMLSVGLQREHLFFKPTVSSAPTFASLNYTNYNAYASWDINTLNSNKFPTRGSRFSLEVKVLNNHRYQVKELNVPDEEAAFDSLFAFDPYMKVTAQSSMWFPLHAKASLSLSPFAGFALNPSNTFGDFYLVGAPVALTRRSIPFYGLNANQIVAQYAAGLGTGYQHRMRKNLFWSVNVNAGWFASPDSPNRPFAQPALFTAGIGASIAYDSFLGPARFTMMYPFAGNDVPDRLNFFLTIGHRF